MNIGEYNPWTSVHTLEEFLYFCCPECDLSRESIYQSRDLFVQHALDHHPKAKFSIQDLLVKQEPIEDFGEYDVDDSYAQSHDTKYEIQAAINPVGYIYGTRGTPRHLLIYITIFVNKFPRYNQSEISAKLVQKSVL